MVGIRLSWLRGICSCYSAIFCGVRLSACGSYSAGCCGVGLGTVVGTRLVPQWY